VPWSHCREAAARSEFIENDLGPEGLARSVVVVATSDAPPVVRLRAAFVATRIAEWFRDTGQDVLLMMDSLTRVAMAQREIGLSAGEPPTTRGYPPSVFGLMPRLLERTGPAAVGSITGLYTVLVEGDDLQDRSATPPGRSSTAVVLSRRLATSGHFPASTYWSRSRASPAVTDGECLRTRPRCDGCSPRTATSTARRSARTPAAATRRRSALALMPRINNFCQPVDAHAGRRRPAASAIVSTRECRSRRGLTAVRRVREAAARQPGRSPGPRGDP
jgi:flagellum-specific ATP synthase